MSRAARRAAGTGQSAAADARRAGAGKPVRGKRVDTVRERTAADYRKRNGHWDRDCAACGADPYAPDPLGLLDYLRRTTLKASTLRSRVDALKRRHRDRGTEIPGMWRPAEAYVRDLDRRERAEKAAAAKAAARGAPARAAARTPSPDPRPMTDDDVKAALHAPPAGDRAHVAKGRAGLLAVHDGHCIDDLAYARTPDTDTALEGTPLPVAVDGRTGPKPASASTAVLSGRSPGDGLPTPADAARDLIGLLPPGTPHVFAHRAANGGRGRQPVEPGRHAARVLNHQIATAAKRANVDWPGPDQVVRLAPDELLAVWEALDPDYLPRLRDHARNTIRRLRLDSFNRLDIAHASRRSNPGADPDLDPDAAYELTRHSSKTLDRDGRKTTARRHPDPDLDPVAALDRLLAALRRRGHTSGPLFPATDRHGRTPAARPASCPRTAASPKQTRAPRTPGPSPPAACAKAPRPDLANAGHDLDHIADELGNDRRNTGLYIDHVRAHVLRL